MSELPIVSIVTPSYNSGQFIEETLLSVRNQTYPNIEHIVVDGGSTDHTVEVLKEYESTYNMRWTSEPDRGMYHAINKGLNNAAGEILSYLNADDLYFPWTVSTAVDALNRKGDADIVYGDFIIFTEEWAQTVFSPLPNRLLLKIALSRISIPQPTTFWRKKVFVKLRGFDDLFQFVGDWEYWLRALPVFRMIKVKEFLAAERTHPRRKMIAGRREMLRERKAAGSPHYPRHSVLAAAQFLGASVYVPLLQRLSAAEFLSALTPNRRGTPWSRLVESGCVEPPTFSQVLLDFLSPGAFSPRLQWGYVRVAALKETILSPKRARQPVSVGRTSTTTSGEGATGE